MRAKDYYSKYGQEFATVAHNMFLESGDILKARGAKTDAALVAVLNELDKKWRAYVRLAKVDGLRDEGFLAYAMAMLPELKRYYPHIEIYHK